MRPVTLMLKILKWFFAGLVSLIILTLVGGRMYSTRCLVQKEWEARMRLQGELAALSTNGKQIIADESGHNIHADQPQLVIEAVKELVR